MELRTRSRRTEAAALQQRLRLDPVNPFDDPAQRIQLDRAREAGAEHIKGEVVDIDPAHALVGHPFTPRTMSADSCRSEASRNASA